MSSDSTASPQEAHSLRATTDSQPTVWVVRANSDEQVDRFVAHGYAGIGWFDLSALHSPEEIWDKWNREHPHGSSKVVGQLKSFRFEMHRGDYVITPFSDHQFLRYGRITGSCESYESTNDESIRNRRKVDWSKTTIPQSALSKSLKRTLASDPTVFKVKQIDDFLRATKKSQLPMDEESDESGLARESEDPNQELRRDPFDSSKIRIQTVPLVVGQLVTRLDYDEIDLNPEFQRNVGVWDAKRRSRLIESLLLRIPIPLFYVAADDDDNWSVVDGVQRISTVYDYVKNKFPLTRLEYRKDLSGKFHEQLPRPMQRRISETQLVINVIQPGTPAEVMFNIFNRINTLGMELTAQEIRNALTTDSVRDYLTELAESREFLAATAKSVRAKRMADRECVLRFLAFHITPWENYSAKSLDAHLDRTMKLIDNMSDSDRASIGAEFRKAMVAAERIFGENAFRKFGFEGGKRSVVNKCLLESWCVQLARCTGEQIDCLVANRVELLGRFATLMRDNREFEKSISLSTGSRERIMTRFIAIRDLVNGALTC